MDTFLRPQGLNLLDDEIKRLTETLSGMKASDKEYTPIANNLKLLCEAREKKNDRTLSYETLLTVGINLIGLLVILNYERAGVITSKAMSLLRFGKS